MPTLHLTPTQAAALADVADHRIVWHPETSPIPGWAWRTGGHLNRTETDDLDTLRHARLIGIAAVGVPCDGNRVTPTKAGERRLREYRDLKVGA